MSHLCFRVRTWWKRQDKPTLYMSQSHPDFSGSSCGLVVKPSEPHLGSSPDGIARCTCCGKGVVEIKCPYKYSDSLQGCTKDEQFCLDKSFALKHSHTYYYQCQLHMFVCDVKYCDFVLWSKKEFIVQRILRNEELLKEALPKAQDFFISSVLPELLTRRHDPVLVSQRACKYCERPDFGKMIICIKCSNHVHYTCAHIKRKPATWLCRECLRVDVWMITFRTGICIVLCYESGPYYPDLHLLFSLFFFLHSFFSFILSYIYSYSSPRPTFILFLTFYVVVIDCYVSMHFCLKFYFVML